MTGINKFLRWLKALGRPMFSESRQEAKARWKELVESK